MIEITAARRFTTGIVWLRRPLATTTDPMAARLALREVHASLAALGFCLWGLASQGRLTDVGGMRAVVVDGTDASAHSRLESRRLTTAMRGELRHRYHLRRTTGDVVWI